MKILMVIHFFSPKFGGSVTVPYELSKQLSKRNHEVTIVTTDFGFDSQYAEMIRADGVCVIPFHCVAHIGHFIYSPAINKWLKQNLKEFDIIHLHDYRSYQNVSVCTNAMKLGIPYIIQAHGSVLPFFEHQNLKKLFDFVWGNKILRDASKLIAVSKREKDQYFKMGLPEDKIKIIPNGIDMTEYEALPERGRFRKKYGIESDEKIVLYLGRLHKSKGIDFLINKLSYLDDEYPDVKLVIAGPDDGYLSILLNQIKKLGVENKVLFTGALYKNEKFEALVDADILVYPGLFEIFGLVPFEAIMCGTPVIVNDDSGCGEIIRESQCGYLVHYGDTSSLKQTINLALGNFESNKKKVQSGRQYVQANLTWDTIGETIENLYKKSFLIKNKK